MKTLQVFYQREGVAGIEHLELAADRTLADLRHAIVAKHGIDSGIILFLDDEDEPADLSTVVEGGAKAGSIRVHVHRCRRVDVAVTFNNRTENRAFAPS